MRPPTLYNDTNTFSKSQPLCQYIYNDRKVRSLKIYHIIIQQLTILKQRNSQYVEITVTEYRRRTVFTILHLVFYKGRNEKLIISSVYILSKLIHLFKTKIKQLQVVNPSRRFDFFFLRKISLWILRSSVFK